MNLKSSVLYCILKKIIMYLGSSVNSFFLPIFKRRPSKLSPLLWSPQFPVIVFSSARLETLFSCQYRHRCFRTAGGSVTLPADSVKLLNLEPPTGAAAEFSQGDSVRMAWVRSALKLKYYKSEQRVLHISLCRSERNHRSMASVWQRLL